MNPPSASAPWFQRLAQGPTRCQLYCFPYAGGHGGIFRPWLPALPGIELVTAELPGHGRRISEPLLTRTEPVVAGLLAAFDATRRRDIPFALFGHSLGALLAFELAHALGGREAPVHVFASGACSPAMRRREAISHLPERLFIDKLRDLNGTPREVFENRELLDLVIPVLRADFEMAERYEYLERPALSCAITAIGGLGDKAVTPRELEGWRDHGRPFRLSMLPGDHFFIHSAAAAVQDLVFRDLENSMAR